MKTAFAPFRTVTLAAFVALLVLVFLVSLPVGSREAEGQAAEEPRFRVLVFSKTTGFRHDSIPAGIAAIRELGAQNDFAVDATEDSGAFTDENLERYDAVVFLQTDGNNLLNGEQKISFERYIQSGGGWAGVHAASNAETNWAWYGDMLGGAYFQNHPGGAQQFQDATMRIEDPNHPSTQDLPAEWTRNDEWYNFKANPRDKVHVLANLDENTYDEQDGSAEADDHPIAWCSPFDGGRTWYTGMGHAGGHFSETDFRSHLLGGIEYAAGAEAGDCGEPRAGIPSDSSFEKVSLDDNTQNPMELDVAPDGRVFYVELGGRVRVYKPETNEIVTAATVPVGRNQENGLLGIALDPKFGQGEPYVYLFYSAPSPEEQHVSRFTVAGDTVDLSSEKVLLRIPHQRQYCCHSAGSMQFGPEGNLFISTGDDTIHYESSGYNPIDERVKDSPNGNVDATRAGDARRTSGSTNDLRGKILRIHPDDTSEAGYTVPEGNLFAPGTERTKPEIYTMGHRNPFRIAVDQETGWVYNGEVGPDAGSDNPNRGPRGYDEFNQIKGPGNYGWPYCIADNKAYNDYNFATGTPGAKFDCAGGPTADPDGSASYLTGQARVPAAKPALVYYPYGSSPDFPADKYPGLRDGPGRTAYAGAVYNHDAENPSETKLPQSYDGDVFIMDWSRDWISYMELDEQGNLQTIQPFMQNTDFRHPHDMDIGPDGSVYLLEWGRDFNYAGSGVNPDSGLYRIDYAKGTRSPIARAAANKDTGPAPLDVQFSSQGSRDPDGDALMYEWNFGDGSEVSNLEDPSHTFTEPGNYTVTLTVTDTTGKTGTSRVVISAGNTRPEVKLTVPEQGGFFDFGDTIRFDVAVTDPEDGENIDCSRVVVSPGLFHDEGGNAHVHPGANVTGCEGTIQVESESGHDVSSNISETMTATYTDGGGQPGSEPLEGSSSVLLNPKVKQAEHFTDASEGRTNNVATARGGRTVGFIDASEWLAFEPMNFEGIDSVTYRYASAGSGGIVKIRAGAPDGPVVSTAELRPTGGWETWREVTAPIADDGTAGKMYFAFEPLPNGGQRDFFDLDEFTFNGKGVSENAAPTAKATADPVQGTAPLKVTFTADGSDPEGGALTYGWDFGVPGTDADTSNEQNPTFTYAQPGTYTARLTVTDDGGRSTTRDVTVRVLQPVTNCLDAGSDQFVGTNLDKSLWTVVDEDPNGYSVADGSLNIRGARSDIHANDGTRLPNIVVQPAPNGAWTATTKINWRPTENYQNAGLVLYQDNGNFMKAGMVHAGGRAFEFFKETNNSAQGQGNVPAPAGLPATFYLRYVSDGTSVTAQYSADGVTFNRIGGPTSLAGITDPKVGVYATNSTQNTAAQQTARFDWFGLDRAGEGPPLGDEFDGAFLDKCRWTVENEDPERYAVSGGGLNITPPVGQDMHAGGGKQANVIVQPMPNGSWTATAKMNWRPTQNYQNAGLVVYADEANFLKTGMVHADGRAFEFFKETNNNAQFQGNAPLQADFPDDFYLRYVYDGSQVRAQYSRDGQAFQNIGGPVSLSGINNPRIGVYATNSTSGTATTPPTARFDWFRVGGVNRAPTVEASADPTTGEAPLAVNFAATAADPDGDQLTYKWDFGVAGTTDDVSTQQDPSYTYDQPGTYTATVTATDAGGATATDTVEVSAEEATVGQTHVIDAVDDGGPSRWVPADITIKPGDTVRWEFDQALVAHTVTSNSENWNLREYRNPGGAAVEYTFDNPGAYAYLCELHGGMAGTITVSDGGEPGNQPPTAEATAQPTSGPAPLEVTFTGGGTDPDGDALTYEWDFGTSDGDADKAATKDATHTYTDPGTYTATLTVADGKGGEATDTAQVSVDQPAENQAPTVEASADPDSGEAPLQVDFSANATDPDGRLVTSGPFKAYADGPTLGYTNVSGEGELVRTRGGTEGMLTVAGLKPNEEYDVHVHAQPCSVNNGGPHYMFDMTKPGTSDNEIWLPFTSDAEGRGHAMAERPQRAGPEAVSIVIHDRAEQGKRIACADLAPTEDDLAYAWDFGVEGTDADASTERNPTYTYTDPGAYTARVTVTDADGATATDTVTVTATRAPDTTKPIVRDLTPRDGSRVRDRTPKIGALVRDDLTDLDKADVKLYVDGDRVWSFDYFRRTDRLSWTPGRKLDFGGHRVRVVATDEAGNTASESWRFRVVRP